MRAHAWLLLKATKQIVKKHWASQAYSSCICIRIYMCVCVREYTCIQLSWFKKIANNNNNGNNNITTFKNRKFNNHKKKKNNLAHKISDCGLMYLYLYIFYIEKFNDLEKHVFKWDTTMVIVNIGSGRRTTNKSECFLFTVNRQNYKIFSTTIHNEFHNVYSNNSSRNSSNCGDFHGHDSILLFTTFTGMIFNSTDP